LGEFFFVKKNLIRIIIPETIIAEIKTPKAVDIHSNNLGSNIKTKPRKRIINPEINFNLFTQTLLKVFLPKVMAKIKQITTKGII
jgi:hypothetical protein